MEHNEWNYPKVQVFNVCTALISKSNYTCHFYEENRSVLPLIHTEH